MHSRAPASSLRLGVHVSSCNLVVTYSQSNSVSNSPTSQYTSDSMRLLATALFNYCLPTHFKQEIPSPAPSAFESYCLTMDRHISSAFKDESFADAYVSVMLAASSNDEAQRPAEGPEELDRFPGHLLLLTGSPYFKSQVNFARQQEEQLSRGRSPARHTAGTTTTASRRRSRSRSPTRQVTTPEIGSSPLQRSSRSGMGSNTGKPTLVLSVSDRSHAPAAVAVIASLYGVDSAFDGLQQEELLLAVQYADMIQVESAARKAVTHLRAAATSGQGLAASTMAALAALPAWPSCLLELVPCIATQATAVNSAPAGNAAAGERAATLTSKNASIQKVLLSALGNLEAIWQQEDLSKVLMQLPLAAMQLLLSSDLLQVYSEDIVRFTVIRYMLHLNVSNRSVLAERAQQLLSVLIRVPHLSPFQLAMEQWNPVLCVKKQEKPLQQLQRLHCVEATQEEFKDFLERCKSNVPNSWLQGPRRQLAPPAAGVRLVWQVSVSQLKALIVKCHDTKNEQSLCSTSKTPPLKGLQWHFEVETSWDSGVKLGLYVMPCGAPSGFPFKFACTVQTPVVNDTLLSNAVDGGKGYGFSDIFELGAMSNGWDETAWVAKGLPVEGDIELALSVVNVW